MNNQELLRPENKHKSVIKKYVSRYLDYTYVEVFATIYAKPTSRL